MDTNGTIGTLWFIPDQVLVKFIPVHIVNKSTSDLNKYMYIRVTNRTFGVSLFVSKWLTGPSDVVQCDMEFFSSWKIVTNNYFKHYFFNRDFRANVNSVLAGNVSSVLSKWSSLLRKLIRLSNKKLDSVLTSFAT